MADHFIGLMSGTSIDALDGVLVNFAGAHPSLIATHSEPLADGLRREIFALCQAGDNEIDRMARVDVLLGRQSAELVKKLLSKAKLQPREVAAIGSHGQTVRHLPEGQTPYTLQIGDPNTIAQLTGITTVADFRRRDLVVGGQGAPLVPAFHQALFRSDDKNRVILNIGGIANITILPASTREVVSGFDTGPGNMLMDAWCQLKRGQPFDDNGNWARSGNTDSTLLARLLEDHYLTMPPPKSTGRERYNLEWLQPQLPEGLSASDIQSTLCELTALSIARAVAEFAPQSEELFVCGGGARNAYLMERISANLTGHRLSTTAELGVDTQWVEAMAFAWMARQTIRGLPGNLPAVTGARESVILGAIYPGVPNV